MDFIDVPFTLCFLSQMATAALPPFSWVLLQWQWLHINETSEGEWTKTNYAKYLVVVYGKLETRINVRLELSSRSLLREMNVPEYNLLVLVVE